MLNFLKSIFSFLEHKKADILLLSLLFAIPINSILTCFDFQNQTITTLNNIYYDFSSSWRLHASRLLQGENLYEDFYYPYPPLGLYIISATFMLTGESIFHQSLFTAAVGLSIHYMLFLLLKEITNNKLLLYAGLFLSFCFLNFSYRHEIFLGGNPFPLLFGFLFFLVGLLLYLKGATHHIFFFLIACSFKHEFWLPTLFVIFLNFKDYKWADYFSFFVILLTNLLLGYNSFEIVSGMGRSEWARWQFHWESGLIHLILTIPMLVVIKYKKLAHFIIYIIFIVCLNNELAIIDYSIIFNSRIGKEIYVIHNSLNIGNLCKYTFLFGFLFIAYKEKNKKTIIFLSIITLLQCRRLFEWSEITYNCLIPIGFIYGYINTYTPKLKCLYKLCLTKVLIISVPAYAINSYDIKKYLNTNDNSVLIDTEIGNICSSTNQNSFNQIKEIIKDKDVICFPFHSGMTLLTGAKLCSPLNYYYSRKRINTFDFYLNDINLSQADYYIIDNNYIEWESYPELQFSLFKWKLTTETINLLNLYPEIKEIIEDNYEYQLTIDNFSFYRRKKK